MPYPKGGYYLNGKRIPSVTTILRRLDDQSSLIHAAVRLAREGKDYSREWGGAAKVGTVTHSMIEMHINGHVPEEAKCAKYWDLTEDQYTEARTAFRAFYDWNKNTKLTKPEQEVSLVSSEYRFGGTFDCLYRSSDGNILCDWKTSKHTTAHHLFQMAAYGILVEEHYGPVDGYYLLHLDKINGDFHHHHWPELDSQKEAFIKMLDVYRIIKETEKRIK